MKNLHNLAHRPDRSGWRFILVLTCLIVSCSPMRGCLESHFELASESRLPKWLSVPAGASRTDVKMALLYYTSLSSDVDNTVFELTLAGQRVHEITGKHWWHPRTAKQLDLYYATEPRPAFPDPSYVITEVDGVIDVIEHRHREQNARDPLVALFWMADDPKILKEAVESAKRR